MPVVSSLQNNLLISDCLTIQQQVVPSSIDRGEYLGLPRAHWQHELQQTLHLSFAGPERLTGSLDQCVKVPVLCHPVCRSFDTRKGKETCLLCAMLHAHEVRVVVRSSRILDR